MCRLAQLEADQLEGWGIEDLMERAPYRIRKGARSNAELPEDFAVPAS